MFSYSEIFSEAHITVSFGARTFSNLQSRFLLHYFAVFQNKIEKQAYYSANLC